MMITIADFVLNQRAYHYRSFEGTVHTVKLKCVDYTIFSQKHDLHFLKLENIHNFDTYFHPLRNIVLKLFGDKII